MFYGQEEKGWRESCRRQKQIEIKIQREGTGKEGKGEKERGRHRWILVRGG